MNAKQKFQMTRLYGQGYSDKWLASKMTPENLHRIINDATATLESGDYIPMNKGFYNSRIRIAADILNSFNTQAAQA
jgi:hypothetical protein